MKKKSWLVMGLVGAMLLSGCGAGKSSDMMMNESAMAPGMEYVADRELGGAALEDVYDSKSEALYDSDMKPGSGFDGTSSSKAEETQLQEAQQGEKLIRTVSLRLQTKEFDSLLTYLDSKVAEYGGYVQNSQIYGNGVETYGYRSADLTFRIPQSNLDEFVSGVSEKAAVVRKTENTENVTLRYADTEAKLKSLKIEQERFLALLEKADTVETILVLEEHLTELRYEIESYASTLKVLDNKVDYATVTLNISEVTRITPVEQNPTLLTRMKDGLSDTWFDLKEGAGNFLVWFVTNILYLLIWGVIIVAAFVIVKKQIKKRKMKNAAKKAGALQQTVEEQDGRMDTEK